MTSVHHQSVIEVRHKAALGVKRVIKMPRAALQRGQVGVGALEVGLMTRVRAAAADTQNKEQSNS